VPTLALADFFSIVSSTVMAQSHFSSELTFENFDQRPMYSRWRCAHSCAGSG